MLHYLIGMFSQARDVAEMVAIEIEPYGTSKTIAFGL